MFPGPVDVLRIQADDSDAKDELQESDTAFKQRTDNGASRVAALDALEKKSSNKHVDNPYRWLARLVCRCI